MPKTKNKPTWTNVETGKMPAKRRNRKSRYDDIIANAPTEPEATVLDVPSEDDGRKIAAGIRQAARRADKRVTAVYADGKVYVAHKSE